MGAICAHARHPKLVHALVAVDAAAAGPSHSMVVGAIAVWLLSWAVHHGCGWLLLFPGSVLWALIIVVGIHIRMWFLVVMGMHIRAWVAVIVDVDAGEGLVVVLHVCVRGQLVVVVGGHVVCCALVMAVHVRGWLFVMVGGGSYGQLSLFVVVHWWYSGAVIVIRQWWW